MIEFINLGAAVQVSLGAGYLAYCTAYAGFRRHHQTRDTIFISLVFAAIASAVISLAQSLGAVPAYILSVLAALVSAAIWRWFGRELWHRTMHVSKVHREDGVETTWENLVQTKKIVDQISVHLSDGRILYLNDRPKYVGTPWDGLYLGSDGSVLMVVEEEELPDGTEEERQGICSDWGTRLTYVPASEITRVNIRLK
ncbi:hypothetical protein MACH17_15680 [Phaeobacter inhibens]|uniref:hypothetical protein n=1 Tax=Phaeobacter inhibens TaxID=221822 RepID=UPI0027703DD7|nr:hypothetical protein [Phaeobacter inhibens]GLO70051.1 hypothetical protein MACH17_15680 [Phaeobacter inhibens]